MVELFTDIKDEVKQTASFIWRMAKLQSNPIHAGEFIDTSIKYLEQIYTEDEMNFVHFYLQMQMEKMKNE